jgi:hypothetical protein
VHQAGDRDDEAHSDEPQATEGEQVGDDLCTHRKPGRVVDGGEPVVQRDGGEH